MCQVLSYGKVFLNLFPGIPTFAWRGAGVGNDQFLLHSLVLSPAI